MTSAIHVVRNQNLFVPHRIVRVGLATTNNAPQPPVAPDTVLDPVGKRRLAMLHESVRDLPKPAKIIKVRQAGEANGVMHPNKVPSLMTAETGKIYPGEHRYAYQIEAGDRLLHLGDPNPVFGRYIRVESVELTYLDGKPVNAKIEATTETNNRVVLHMQGNAQVRLVTNREDPYG